MSDPERDEGLPDEEGGGPSPPEDVGGAAPPSGGPAAATWGSSEAAGSAGSPEEPDGPVLPRMPDWVPAGVVAGAVLLLSGLVVSRIRPGATEGSTATVGDLAMVVYLLGGLSLVAGFSAFLLSRVSLVRTIEAVVLTGVAGLSYFWLWRVAFQTLNGDAASILGIREAGLTGKGAALGAIAWIVVSVAVFVLAFRWLTGIVWPYFRSGVALNVLAMVHIVVVLLGVVNVLNRTFVPLASWSTVDLTESGRYTLSDKTRALLGKVDGELLVYYVDFGAARRSSYSRSDEARVRDLLLQYAAACPRMTYRPMDALREPDELRKAFLEGGMESLLEGLTAEEDSIVLGYRPPGEKLVARTKVVAVNSDFHDMTALGNEQFKGEGILTNAVNEVVFARRRILFTEGHGEFPSTGGSARNQSVSALAGALRGDNFTVDVRNLSRDPSIPADTDLVCVCGPKAPLSGSEVDALKEYLGRGGSVLLFLDAPPPEALDAPTGLEDLLDAWGIRPRRDCVVVSYIAEDTMIRGRQVAPITQILCTRDEFGRHPAMAALRNSTFSVVFDTAIPILHTEKTPPGVELQDLVYAPRLVADQYKPFGMKRAPGQNRIRPPQDGDIVDVRIPLGVSAERAAAGSEKGGGRLIVFGDTNFVTDIGLDPGSPTAGPARTLVLNTVSWAVRRDLIAVDPKAIETETVKLRPLDEDLTLWATVVGIPLMVLGLAVGVWWTRRR